MKTGDYVLATKYKDGDPMDHWFVGFFKCNLTEYSPRRYDVIDESGESVRGNGFRRVKVITKEQGDYILSIKNEMYRYKSVWQCLREVTHPE